MLRTLYAGQLVMLSTLVFAGASVLSACPDNNQTFVPSKLGQKGESCNARNDCASGLACVASVCVIDEFNIAKTAKGCDVIQCNAPEDCVQIVPACRQLKADCDAGNSGACTELQNGCDYACVDNLCITQCENDTECPFNWKCNAGSCVQCVADGDCDSTEKCVSNFCVEPCASSLECPVFHVCNNGECVDEGCASDRECVALLGNVEAICNQGQCLTPCISDTDCDSPTSYDFWSCQNNVCQYMGCETDDECRAAVFGNGSVPDGIIDVTCREGADDTVTIPSIPGGPAPSNCDTLTQYECSDTSCISLGWVCDGVSDCPFGEDEANCN